MIEEKNLVKIASLGKTHGYGGELKYEGEFPAVLYEAGEALPWIFNIDGIFVPFFPVRIKAKDFGGLVEFEGYGSKEEAKMFVNREAYSLKTKVADILGVNLEELASFEINYIGYEVEDAATGEIIGTVEDIEEAPEYDYLVVGRSASDEPVRIPFLPDFIIEETESGEDGTPGRFKVTLPDGMLEIND